LCDNKADIYPFPSLVILLLKILSLVSDGLFCKALAILIAPAVCNLFPCKVSTCRLVLCDKTAAISSAAFSVILLLLIPSLVSDEMFLKALAIL